MALLVRVARGRIVAPAIRVLRDSCARSVETMVWTELSCIIGSLNGRKKRYSITSVFFSALTLTVPLSPLV